MEQINKLATSYRFNKRITKSLSHNYNSFMHKTTEKILLGGGCFWCIEAAFQTLNGVTSVESGYAGGHITNPSYREVCSGNSGHAEVVKIEWDPEQVNLEHLLAIFFKVHDPTTLNRQGNDTGPQYRSFIGYSSEKQRSICKDYIDAIQSQFTNSIVTELVDSPPFYLAEIEHQNYYKNNTSQPYCQLVIKPKLDKIQ